MFFVTLFYLFKTKVGFFVIVVHLSSFIQKLKECQVVTIATQPFSNIDILIPDFVYDVINKFPTDIQWLVKLHPNQLHQTDDIIRLIKQKLNDGIPALIMVRNIEPDERNPFTTEQTVSMIRKYHASHGDDVEVMIIPDIESVNYGRGVGYEINEFQPPADSGAMFISATKIRESIKNGDNTWKTMVDDSLHIDIEGHLG